MTKLNSDANTVRRHIADVRDGISETVGQITETVGQMADRADTRETAATKDAKLARKKASKKAQRAAQDAAQAMTEGKHAAGKTVRALRASAVALAVGVAISKRGRRKG